VDDTGRERYFHGVNVVNKGAPFVPDTVTFDPYMSYTEKDAAALESVGLNVIRLGVMWAGVEPQRATFNQTYLDQIAKIVNISAAHGVYSLFDMHEDVLSEKFCGEGTPSWAAQPSGV
jgi:endoglycosylceramidase